MFHVNSNANNAQYLKFCGRKFESTEVVTLAIIREISDSNLETGRYGPKTGVFRNYPGELTALYGVCPWVLEDGIEASG